MTIWTCNAGSFRGFEKSGCAHVTGIRYATSKRWEPPIPYLYDEGVHECTSPAPFAVQLPSLVESSLAGTAYETFPQEESCQYLSITMPMGTTPESSLPVMVWIHGGAYRNGGCDGPSYDRSPLVRENGVIVVAVNYRLGVLGFVRDKDGKPSNNGLLDILEALRWVNRNISAFGGDPENVTLFGQSAGADAVMRIMAIEGTTFFYELSWMQGKSVLGASHCSDCLLLFGAGDAEGEPGCMGLSAQEILEAGAPFRRIWADFAKTGKVGRTSLDEMVEIRKLDNVPTA